MKAAVAKEAWETKAALEKALAEVKAVAEVHEQAKKAKKAVEEETAKLKLSDTQKLLIHFKDAVGRDFSLPWHLCKTWNVLMLSLCIYRLL